MEADQNHSLKIAWVLADDLSLDPTLDIERLKEIGSFWGGWKTWRSHSTDNVICSDRSKATELVQREFYRKCNFFVTESVWVFLGRPPGVNVYGGEFKQDPGNADEIIAMHLAASQNDIVLMLGFDFGNAQSDDALTKHRQFVKLTMYKHAIKENPLVQWVLIDQPREIAKDFLELSNLTQDRLENVIT